LEIVLHLCCYGTVLDFMKKKTIGHKKTLDYKCVTDFSDYKKIGVVLKNRLPLFHEHYILIVSDHQMVDRTRTHKQLFFYGLKSFNTAKIATSLQKG